MKSKQALKQIYALAKSWQKLSVLVWYSIAVIIFCLSIWKVSLRIREATFSFDDSLNMQTSVTLAYEFIYRSLYRPAEIYGFSVSTNGPVQYVMATAVKLFGMDTAREVVLNLFFFSFLCALFSVSSLAMMVFSALLLIWPTYLNSTVVFLGELPVLGFCLWGIFFIEKWKQKRQRRDIYLAGILFGFALSTKFITIFLLPFLMAILIWEGKRLKEIWRELSICLGVALSVFVVGYYFSVLHSFVMLHFWGMAKELDAPYWHGLFDFILQHFLTPRERGQPTWPLSSAFLFSPWLYVFFLGCAPVAIYKNRAMILLWLLVAVLFAFSGLNERRMLPFLFFPIFFGCFYFSQLWMNLRYRKGTMAQVLVMAIFVICGLFSFWQSSDLAARTFENASYYKPTSAEVIFFRKYGRIAEVIETAEYPIITGGWWQFPQISLRSGTVFYDRMRPENYAALKKAKKVYLLFREDLARYWPYTTKKLCGHIVFEEKGNTLCEFNRNLPFDKI
ncbi:MAG: hypothetical protein ACXWQO_02605 [Bdellovibrionota bacterium]